MVHVREHKLALHIRWPNIIALILQENTEHISLCAWLQGEALTMFFSLQIGKTFLSYVWVTTVYSVASFHSAGVVEVLLEKFCMVMKYKEKCLNQ